MSFTIQETCTISTRVQLFLFRRNNIEGIQFMSLVPITFKKYSPTNECITKPNTSHQRNKIHIQCIFIENKNHDEHLFLQCSLSNPTKAWSHTQTKTISQNRWPSGDLPLGVGLFCLIWYPVAGSQPLPGQQWTRPWLTWGEEDL